MWVVIRRERYWGELRKTLIQKNNMRYACIVGSGGGVYLITLWWACPSRCPEEHQSWGSVTPTPQKVC